MIPDSPAPVRLAIDAREACGERPTGKGRWTLRFVEELLRRGHPLALLTDREAPAAWRAHADIEIIPERGLRWHLRAASLAPRIADIYVSPTSYIVPWLLGRRMPVFPVVHDLIAFRGEPHDRRATRIERLTLSRAARTARRILTVSESTKNDLLAREPRIGAERVTPIFAGPSWGAASSPARDASATGDASIVCIGTLCPRKNQLRLIRAFDALPSPLRQRATLTLVGGRGWDDEEIVKAAASTPGVTWRDYLPDAECDALLAGCAAFAFPSLYEGFGLPVLDALQQGIPVLTSDRGSLREVAGSAALLCDPLSVPALACELERLLTDAELRADLSRRGRERAEAFSWARTVDLFLEAIG
jgi:alpha-1,3-rhamnosyl/mannosyltransferase